MVGRGAPSSIITGYDTVDSLLRFPSYSCFTPQATDDHWNIVDHSNRVGIMASVEFRGELTLNSSDLYHYTRSKRSSIQSLRRAYPRLPTLRSNSKRYSSVDTPCQDWIFSSATNVHVAIDKSAFKTFTPFDTYVLTVGSQRQISVEGIGAIDLTLRCKPGSRDKKTISLEDVLYIPTWPCNIFSDVYLHPVHDYEHRWSNSSLLINHVSGGKSKPWGYTESFHGLDRLILARKPVGRSPIQDDPDREVWSINVNWPRSQRDAWEFYVRKEFQRRAAELDAEIMIRESDRLSKSIASSAELLALKNTGKETNQFLKSGSPPSTSKTMVHSGSPEVLRGNRGVEAKSIGAKTTLQQLSENTTISKGPRDRIASLRGTLRGRKGSLKGLFGGRAVDKENATPGEDYRDALPSTV